MKSSQLTWALAVLKWPVFIGALALLLRGFDNVGGGFAAGLLLSVYFILQTYNAGPRIEVVTVLTIGLILAFLSALWNTMVFELAVGLTVLGSVTAIGYAVLERDR